MSASPGQANRFLSRLRAGEQQVGVWMNLRGIGPTEITAQAGYDWVMLDQEHAPRPLDELAYTLATLRGFGVPAIVRAASHDPHGLSQLLDLGAQTIMVPMVESAEQAAGIASACSFPPVGTRGVSGQTRGGNWGSTPGYVLHARESVCLIAQIESAQGCDEAAAIAATPGVDALFFGPADLAATMGYPGQPQHPEVLAALQGVEQIARDAGLPYGTLAKGAEAGQAALDSGYQYVGVGTDTAMLFGAHRALTTNFSAR